MSRDLPVFFRLVEFRLLYLFHSNRVHLLLAFSICYYQVPYRLSVRVTLLTSHAITVARLRFCGLVLFYQFC